MGREVQKSEPFLAGKNEFNISLSRAKNKSPFNFVAVRASLNSVGTHKKKVKNKPTVACDNVESLHRHKKKSKYARNRNPTHTPSRVVATFADYKSID